MLCAISLSGWVATMTIEAPTDGDVFLTYLEQVLCPQLRPGQVVVMDNLSAHQVEGVRARIGSGANLTCGKFGRCDISIDPNSDQADNMARQISGSVARRPPSLPILNCPFLIFSASSIPLITMSAVSKLLSPNIGRNRCLILR